jgi:hypothetical protein
MSSPEATRDRGAHVLPVEPLALDLARFQDVLGQRVENNLRAKLKTETLHTASETTLTVPHIHKTC